MIQITLKRSDILKKKLFVHYQSYKSKYIYIYFYYLFIFLFKLRSCLNYIIYNAMLECRILTSSNYNFTIMIQEEYRNENKYPVFNQPGII